MTAKRLPAGHHGLARSFVIHNQRERILAAVADAAADKGYQALTVQDIVCYAGVSRRTFYQNFSDKQDAFFSALDVTVQQAYCVVTASIVADAPWPHQVRRGLQALLEFIACEPAFARMAYVDIMMAGPEGIARHDAAVASFEVFLAQGFALAEHPIPPLVAKGIGGAINELVASCVLREAYESIPELLPTAVYLCLVPFLGPATAAKEARAACEVPSGVHGVRHHGRS